MHPDDDRPLVARTDRRSDPGDLAGNAALEAKSLDQLLADLASVPENIRGPVRNNGGGHWNHSFFWKIMGPRAGGAPTGKLADETARAKHQIDVYQSRGDRFRMLAPYAHRWLPNTPFSTLMVVCFFVFSCTTLKAFFRIWNGILVARIGNIVGYDLRQDFYRQMLRLDIANFNETGRGDLMTRCTGDLGTVSQGVQRLFGQALAHGLQRCRFS